jgi:hypothetical protein
MVVVVVVVVVLALMLAVVAAVLVVVARGRRRTSEHLMTSRRPARPEQRCKADIRRRRLGCTMESSSLVLIFVLWR